MSEQGVVLAAWGQRREADVERGCVNDGGKGLGVIHNHPPYGPYLPRPIQRANP